MNERFESSSSQEEIGPDRMRAIIQDVIDETFTLFNAETMANYDADFSGEEPCFYNIRAIKTGRGFGYIIFHDFLRRVGINKTFLSDDFTSAGEHLFEKAEKDGLVQKESEKMGLGRYTRWRVVGDPVRNLERLRDGVVLFD